MLGVIKETAGRLLYLLPKCPFQAQIEITNKCNLDCAMCPRENIGVEYRHMDFDIFKKIINKLSEVRLITLTGWGEPFMHPNIFDMIKICKKKGFQVQLTTNGIFPSDSTSERIVNSGIDSISFSIDTLNSPSKFGHKNDEARVNIEKILELRNNRKPKVTVQSTIQKNGEDEICRIIRWGASVGIDNVNLGRLDQRFDSGLPRPSLKEENEILDRTHKLGRENGVQIDCIQYSVGNGVQREIYKILKHALHRFGKYCLKTYSYVYINLNGDVTPCCGLPRYKIDNIIKNELKNIWYNKKFIEFREKQSEVCGKCDLWSIKYLS
tara:strand:- start:27587 stop:28558 length:972 start_codon:yes stop_codon:yes gene_type:complete